MIERQEIYCHECCKYVQFNIDTSLDGNHVLKCPNCGHEHCRVVNKGKITDIRWDSRNRSIPVHNVSTATITTSSTSTFDLYNGGTSMYNSWMNTTVSTGSYTYA